MHTKKETEYIYITFGLPDAFSKLTQLLNHGDILRANHIVGELKFLEEKIVELSKIYHFVVILSSLERIVLKTVYHKAEDVVERIKKINISNKKICIGIGLTASESAIAFQKSCVTKRTELFIPKDFFKNESLKKVRFDVDKDFMPNVFDPELADSDDTTKLLPAKEPKTVKLFGPRREPKKVVVSGSLKDAMESEKQLIDSIVKELMPSQPTNQPKQLSTEFGVNSRTENDEGKHSDNADKNIDSDDVPGATKKSDKTDDKEESRLSNNGELSSDLNEKFFVVLAYIKRYLPKIINLYEHNPDLLKQLISVFKTFLNFLSKLHKAQRVMMFEPITKTNKIHSKKIIYPIGTRLKRRKKVVGMTKPVWREMGSGQVKDPYGQPISVKTYNRLYAPKKQ